MSLVAKKVVQNFAAQLIGEPHRRLLTAGGKKLYSEEAVTLTADRDEKMVLLNFVVM